MITRADVKTGAEFIDESGRRLKITAANWLELFEFEYDDNPGVKELTTFRAMRNWKKALGGDWSKQREWARDYGFVWYDEDPVTERSGR